MKLKLKTAAVLIFIACIASGCAPSTSSEIRWEVYPLSFKEKFSFPGYWEESLASRYTPDNVHEYLNGGAPSYLALGFQELHVIELRRAEPVVVDEVEIVIEIYLMGTEANARQILATETEGTTTTSTLPGGTRASVSSTMIQFSRDSFYVKVFTFPGSSVLTSEIEEIVHVVEEKLGKEQS